MDVEVAAPIPPNYVLPSPKSEVEDEVFLTVSPPASLSAQDSISYRPIIPDVLVISSFWYSDPGPGNINLHLFSRSEN